MPVIAAEAAAKTAFHREVYYDVPLAEKVASSPLAAEEAEKVCSGKHREVVVEETCRVQWVN